MRHTTQEWAYVQRLQRRASNVAPDLAQAELRAYYLIRQALTDAEAARAIQNGTMDRLIAEILDDRTGGPFAALRGRLDRATLDAAESEAGMLPSRYQAGVFDRLSPYVVEATRRLSTRTIDTLKTETQEMVREQVRLGIEAGKNPRVIARELKELIGLAPNQARAVQNFRRELETGDRAALDRMLKRGVLMTPDGEEVRRFAHAGGEGLSGRDLRILERETGSVYWRASPAVATRRFNDAGGLYVFRNRADAEMFAQFNPDRVIEPITLRRNLRVKIVDDMTIEVVGLDKAALDRYRADGYDVIVNSGLDVGKRGEQAVIIRRDALTDPLTPEQIDRMVTAYEKRMHAWNVESHARTMALDANKQASRLAWEDAVNKGVVDRSALRKVWVTVGDDRVRPEHEELNGTEVGFDDPFPNGEQTPGDSTYNCRCLARIIVRQQAVAA